MKNSCFSGSYGTLFVLAVLASCLCGCATTNPPAIPEGTKSVNFDKSLLQDCKDLPHTKSASDEDLKDWASTVSQQYTECASFKKRENAEVKKALNVKE